MIGYFVEVPQAAGEELLKAPFRETFVHRQTMAGAMRFSTVELGELEAKIASAADRALRIELGSSTTLSGRVARAGDRRRGGRRSRVIDVTAALADLGRIQAWTRPEVDASLAFAIEADATRSSRPR